jgi:tetratricopeptide (TPR) repeat protein
VTPRGRALLVVLAIGLISVGCRTPGDTIDPRLETLQKAIGTEPLDTDATDRLSDEKQALDTLTRDLEGRDPGKNQALLDWQVGECHRLRHLFDEQDAWEHAEQRLSLAIARDPKMGRAHLSLGQLYLTGGEEYASRAERAFVRALEESGDAPAAEAHKGLFLACYYQGRWAEAVKEADRYLAKAGPDTSISKMRDMAQTNLRQESRKTK